MVKGGDMQMTKLIATALVLVALTFAVAGPAHAAKPCTDITQCCPPGAMCVPNPF